MVVTGVFALSELERFPVGLSKLLVERFHVGPVVGIVAHPADADSILAELLPDFQRSGIPLYLYDGTAVWPPQHFKSG